MDFDVCNLWPPFDTFDQTEVFLLDAQQVFVPGAEATQVDA